MIGELAALGAAISWTVSAIFYKKALRDAKPISANIIRLALTAPILVLLIMAIGRLSALASLPLEVVVLASLSGIVGLGFGDTLYFASLEKAGVSRAVPITCIYPLFSLVWAIVFAGERITIGVIIGATVTIVGALLLGQGSTRRKGDVQEKIKVLGMLFALAAALAWSVSIAMMGIAVKETPDLDHAFAINTVRVASIAGLMLVSSPVADRKLRFLKVSKKAVIALIVGGVVALGLGWFLLSYSLALSLQSRVVPISSTTPLFSTFAAILLLGEKVTARNVLGSMMIVIGIFLLFLV